jgi:2-octaprenyl-6-methoxyphenol hydroxylase
LKRINERITVALHSTDVAVVGAGPAGLTAALALASAGVAVTLIGSHAGDNRTTALLASSITALETLGIWQDCVAQAAPLDVMRIVDDTGRLWRAPELRFVAAEIGLNAFGWNIENRHLVAALERHLAGLPNVTLLPLQATGVDFLDDAARVALDGGGTVDARLLVAADGRRSLCREAAGITAKGWSYPQVAVTLNFAHSRPHENISTEFHTPHGPFTVVPLPDQRSSLVCVVQPAEAADLVALDAATLNDEIERRSHSILGKVTVEPGVGQFPLRVETAEKFAADRLVLVGEAAHTIPPIGAQGFNLGLRDAATIAELVAQAKRDDADIGGASITAAYNRSRQADAMARRLTADLLNRSLLSDFLPVQGMRGLGLYMIDRIGPLRRAVMREGVAPAASMPKLMRGEPV